MFQERKRELNKNLTAIHSELELLTKELKKDTPDLICVSKNHPLKDILIANQLGETKFGENRVQELIKKQELFMQLPEEERMKYDFHWHFIGTLQRNKVKDIVGLVELIHSVDTLRLIRRINYVSKQRELKTNILLQVNIAKEKGKHGFTVDELPEAIALTRECANINLKGLMMMAPFYKDPSLTQVLFQETQNLLATHQKQVGKEFKQLSMGMSQDYIYAIKEGATMIRLGTKIFGNRNN